MDLFGPGPEPDPPAAGEPSGSSSSSGGWPQVAPWPYGPAPLEEAPPQDSAEPDGPDLARGELPGPAADDRPTRTGPEDTSGDLFAARPADGSRPPAGSATGTHRAVADAARAGAAAARAAVARRTTVPETAPDTSGPAADEPAAAPEDRPRRGVPPHSPTLPLSPVQSTLFEQSSTPRRSRHARPEPDPPRPTVDRPGQTTGRHHRAE